MKKLSILFLMSVMLHALAFAQHSDESIHILKLEHYQDTLVDIGKHLINDGTEMERQNANAEFIRAFVKALKVPNSFNFKFDSLKVVHIINAPDNRFRIFTWYLQYDDGSYRYYGTVQMNTGDKLVMFPLEDYSPFMKNPEDSVTSNTKWYGAVYYKIVPVYAEKNPYYVLLGWKGNTVKSTKKVIDVITFRNDRPVFGHSVFDGNGKVRKRVVFEYTRQASMLLNYVPDEHLIVFDHLVPPDKKQKGQFDQYGPDLSYDGYRFKEGRWEYVENLDMRNKPDSHDADYIDPKKQRAIDRASGGGN
jgi:hypothetical protein